MKALELVKQILEHVEKRGNIEIRVWDDRRGDFTEPSIDVEELKNNDGRLTYPYCNDIDKNLEQVLIIS